MSGDVERLAEEVWQDEPTDAERDIARLVLASDWLAERDQKMQAAGAALNVLAHGSQHPDMETYARIYNEGWDAAMLAQVAPDPTTADDWLAAHDAEVEARALREAAEVVESSRRQNPMNGDGSNYTIDRVLTHLVGAEERDRLHAEHQQRWNDEYLAFRARADRVAGHAQEDDRG